MNSNRYSATEHALRLVSDGILSIDREGRIWRHARRTNGGLKRVPTRRAESPGGNGYLRVMLWIDGRLYGVSAHRLVWIHANGPIPDGLQINHKDGQKRNNALANLEVVTGGENIRHSYAIGRRHPWSDATLWRGRPRLTTEDALEAQRLRSDGVILREIAERFGISISHAHRVSQNGPRSSLPSG